MNKVPTILTYNNHDILLKKKSAFTIGTQIQLLHCGEMGWSVFEASVFCAKYYLVQVKKWEESEMLDKKFKRESLKWISMTCFSDHAENVVLAHTVFRLSSYIRQTDISHVEVSVGRRCHILRLKINIYSITLKKEVEHNLVVVVW